MTQVANTAEGGSSGTTVTTGNSGGGSGDAFDGITIPASGTLEYTNVHVAHGSLAYKIATAGTSGECVVKWSTAMGSGTDLYFRLNLYLTALPAVDLDFFRPYNAGTEGGRVRLKTTGKLAVLDKNGTETVGTGSSMATGQPVRVEVRVKTSASALLEAKLWNSVDSSGSPDDDVTAAAVALLATTTEARFGIRGGANVGPIYMDDLIAGATTWPGPAGVASTFIPKYAGVIVT